MTVPRQPPKARIGAGRLMVFSVVALATGGVQTPLQIYLAPLYTQYVGLGLGTVGTIILLSRLWNAATDPMVGILSDRTRTRFGQRKPWIAAGGLLFVLASLAVFFPHPGANSLYLGLSLFALYLGWSMVQTPLYAWAGSLSDEYHERTRVQAYVQTAASIGVALILVLPIIEDRLGDSTQIGRFALMGWVIILAMAIGAAMLVFLFKERPVPVLKNRATIGGALRILVSDKLVLRVIGSDFFVSLGQGFRGPLLVFFVSAFMGLPVWATLALPFIQYGFGILSSPTWMRIGRRFGKHQTLVAAELTQAAINLCLLLLSPGQIWPLIVLTVAQGLTQGSGNLMLRAIVSDVADRQRLMTGQNHMGLLFSIFNVTINAGMGLSPFIALHLLGLMGFVPGATNSASSLTALRLMIAVGPAFGHSISAFLMVRFPLDQKRHAEIVRALERQAAEAGDADIDDRLAPPAVGEVPV